MTLHDLNGNGSIADDAGAFMTGANVRLYLDDGDGFIGGADAFVASTTVRAPGPTASAG